MRARIPSLLLALGVFATGCVDAPGPAPTAPRAGWLASAGEPVVSRTTAAVDHTIFQPCAAELVDLTGHLRVGILSRATGPDRYDVRYTVDAAQVTGSGRSTGGVFRLAGAVAGDVTVDRRERIVTVADFRILATRSPGVAVGRGRAAPRAKVALSFPVPVEGKLPDARVDAVAVDQKCGA